MNLTILMPCLNEAETLPTCISQAKSFFSRSSLTGEILIADNGSTDGSGEIAQAMGCRVIRVEQKGYGSALIAGIEAAQGNYVIMGDADASYDFTSLQEFVDALDAGNDLVMGNRFRGGIMPKAMPALHRYLGNPVLSWLGRLFFHNHVGDFHSGLRAFRKEAILSLDLQTTGMEFASEMVVKASLRGLKISEVPIKLYPDGRNRPPHLRTWSDGWRHLRFLLLFSPRWLFLIPGLVLMIIGVSGTLWLLPGPRNLGKITLDINTLMYAGILVILGLQAVIFSLLTEIFGIQTGLRDAKKGTKILLKLASLERGILTGISAMVVGLASSIVAFAYWGSREFGEIDPMVSMRLVIPGSILFACGIQIVFSSFFMSILLTNRKR